MSVDRNSHSGLSRRQNGAALLVALVLLVAVTLLGVSAMQGTILQERMSANQRDVEEAFNAAEIALRTGERELLGDPFDFLGVNSLNDPGQWPADDNRWTDDDVGFEQLEVGDMPAAMATGNYAEMPRYHIAERGVVCATGQDASAECDEIFTITAQGTGRTINTFVVLQSTVRIRE